MRTASRACAELIPRYTPVMATVTEIEQLALDLPESERAVLAGQLLRSLPSVLHDADDGVAEALRRDAEFEANPAIAVTDRKSVV